MALLRRRARLITLACLPVLLLRALTPVGFMPMHDAQGGLYLAFCPGLGDTMPPPIATDDPHRGHHGMGAHGDHGAAHDGASTGDQRAPSHQNVCPYALSAGPALAYALPEAAGTVPLAVALPAPAYLSISLPPIERAQSARAPPAPRIA